MKNNLNNLCTCMMKGEFIGYLSWAFLNHTVNCKALQILDVF